MKNQSAFVKLLIILLFLIALSIVLIYGKVLLLPLVFGAVFAFLVNPIDKRLRTWKVNRFISAILSVGVIVTIVFTLLSIFGWQINQLYNQSDKILEELVEVQQKGQSFLKQQFGITVLEQEEYANKAVETL